MHMHRAKKKEEAYHSLSLTSLLGQKQMSQPNAGRNSQAKWNHFQMELIHYNQQQRILLRHQRYRGFFMFSVPHLLDARDCKFYQVSVTVTRNPSTKNYWPLLSTLLRHYPRTNYIFTHTMPTLVSVLYIAHHYLLRLQTIFCNIYYVFNPTQSDLAITDLVIGRFSPANLTLL